MSSPQSTAQQLVSDLERELSRAQPSDPLQWTANWCLARLESERLSFLSSSSSSSTRAGGAVSDSAMRDTTPPLSAKSLPGQHHPVGPASPDRVVTYKHDSHSNLNRPNSLSASGYSFGNGGGGARNIDTDGKPSPYSELPPSTTTPTATNDRSSQPPSPFTRVGPRSASGGDASGPGATGRQTTLPAPLSFGGPLAGGAAAVASPTSAGAARSSFAARSPPPAPLSLGGDRSQLGGQQYGRGLPTAAADDDDSDEEVEDPRDDPNFHPSKAGGGLFGGAGAGSAGAGGGSGANNGKLGIPHFNMARRTSVSAESLDPNAPVSTAPKTVIPKTESQLSRIETSIANNLLFRNLDEDQHKDVLNAMKEVSVNKGTEVIVQGAVGDYFYVVEQGSFEAWVRAPPTHHYSGPGQGATTVPGEEKKVATYGPGGSFGELALMYNAPRAATVVATSRATMWALDRVTFRTILMEHTSRKRKMYEAFLSEVPILASLNAKERAKIADALEEKIYDEGENVVVEGEVGKNFYIIESGKAEVLRRRRASASSSTMSGLQGASTGGYEEEVLGSLSKGDYFGELALLNSAPRAATVRAMAGQGRLRVATLGEKAFTRLLGPVIDILQRKAGSYGNAAAQSASASASGGAGPNSSSSYQGQGHSSRASYSQSQSQQDRQQPGLVAGEA